MNKASIDNHFLEAIKSLKEFHIPENMEKIALAISWMSASLQNKGKIISCGNGGSMCDARNNRKALAAVSISDPSHISCVANDYGYDFVFSRYVEGLGHSQDVLLGISTSGNSKNVILAVQAAKALGMKTIVLTGKDGGKLAEIADLEIRAPHSDYADRAQEIHIKVIHAMIDGIESELGL